MATGLKAELLGEHKEVADLLSLTEVEGSSYARMT